VQSSDTLSAIALHLGVNWFHDLYLPNQAVIEAAARAWEIWQRLLVAQAELAPGGALTDAQQRDLRWRRRCARRWLPLGSASRSLTEWRASEVGSRGRAAT
jgi:hypothetical protein